MVHCVYLDKHVPCYSGLNAIITVGTYNHVRVDLMDGTEPVISFSGNDIAKMRHCMEYWFAQEMIELSSSHLMYIGNELQRASILGRSYVQG
jgi:hypothetical protein